MNQLLQGLNTAFIDKKNNSNTLFRPQFISNNPKAGKKVLSSIEDELKNCDSFCFSVAFITMSGITPLLQVFKELEEKNVPGKILTTDYLNFSEPKALEKLQSLKNIEIKMYSTSDAGVGFHPKGYIFKKDDIYKILIGSSNLTLSALTTNKEWNTKIVSSKEGELSSSVVSEFNELWDSDNAFSFNAFIEKYKTAYSISKEQRKEAFKSSPIPLNSYRLKPNSMQTNFIENLQLIREEGNNKALLISATGTGKTYASAFGLREFSPKRALFLVHREQIAKQAIESYKRVFPNDSFGLISGSSKQFDSKFIFSTMQMMSKNEIMSRFGKNEFDVIVIDEAHRVGAYSYQKILDYFTPNFWLGLTASPERTDDFDVFKAFDHNIAYEIRLQQALSEDLLCPFHYFGITDILIDGESITDDRSDKSLKQFKYLTSDDRVNYIITQANYYGYSGDRVKGLIFCSNKKEAKILSEKFNKKGYKTTALTGEDSQEKRSASIEKLVTNSKTDYLDYIFTVDIFNEGVDIPEINQVIMLRPTQSPIIFVQQLGRGLRKAYDKEYVVVLDFIGNYKNNFMIPIALSGDRSYNKDNVRRYVMEGERIIPGSSTIHFDEISTKQIFKAIDSANFSAIQRIKDSYLNLKYKLGRIPKLSDFDKYGEIDVLRIFDNPNLGSYHTFLKKYEPDYSVQLNKTEESFVEFISKKLASGKRVHELELIKLLFTEDSNIIRKLKLSLKDNYNISLKDIEIDSIINVLTNEFPKKTDKAKYPRCIFIKKDKNGDYSISNDYKKLLYNTVFRNVIKELIDFGISRYQRDYKNRYKETNFVLNQKYTYEDICRLLNWKQNEVALNIGGYKYNKDTKTYPVFINYHKEENIQDTIKYEDHFLNESTLVAISKQGRTLQSEDVQNFIYSKERNISVELFVRKNKDDKGSKEFYYLGEMYPTGEPKEFTMANTNKTAVELHWELDSAVREDIYRYIVND